VSQLNMGPALEDLPPCPVAGAALQRRHEDMAELMRLAAVAALKDGGKHLSPAQRVIAQRRAAQAPLNRPLGTGDHVSSPQHPND
jgi:hypothetical protein